MFVVSIFVEHVCSLYVDMYGVIVNTINGIKIVDKKEVSIPLNFEKNTSKKSDKVKKILFGKKR